jgi:hypothetical protein
MTKNDFIQMIENFESPPDSYDDRGITNHVFITFSKWRSDERWEFVQSNMTKSGIHYAASVFAEDIFNKQHIKVLFVDGNTNELIEIVNTEKDYAN